MRFKATHDALTGLWNRGVISELLVRDRRAHRDECIAVLLCDIDHFKQVNDTYGHAVGDEVLREVARRLQGAVRSYDFVGRYGGEEFLIILNSCEPTSALTRAEQMRETIAKQEVITDGGALRVTQSVGLLRSTDWEGSSAAECLCEADSALATRPKRRAAIACGWRAAFEG